MPLTTVYRDARATALAAAAPYMLAIAGTPATSGAATNEVSGGSYARVAASWGSVSGGVIVTSATAINIPSGVTVDHCGVAASVTATTADVKATASVTSQTFSSAGTYTITLTDTESST